MFFKMSVFKKLIKSAYKRTGFYIGLDAEGTNYYIRTPRFTMWMDVDNISNQAKAAVIEFTGELPQPGFEFLCSEAQECNQYSFLGAEHDIRLLENNAKAGFCVTKLCDVRAGARYLYSKFDDVVVNSILIPESLLALIDPGAIDTDNREKPPIGPVAFDFNDDQVFWYNDTSALMVKDVLSGCCDEAKAYALEIAKLEAECN